MGDLFRNDSNVEQLQRWSAKQQLFFDEMADSIAEATDERIAREERTLELSERQTVLLEKSLEASLQSGKVAEEALKVGRQSRALAAASLGVAAMSLTVAILMLLAQLGFKLF